MSILIICFNFAPDMGILYIVPTPVGNMEDMTFRAVRILKEVDLVLAEDTRTSGILLKHYEINRTISLMSMVRQQVLSTVCWQARMWL